MPLHQSIEKGLAGWLLNPFNRRRRLRDFHNKSPNVLMIDFLAP